MGLRARFPGTGIRDVRLSLFGSFPRRDEVVEVQAQLVARAIIAMKELLVNVTFARERREIPAFSAVDADPGRRLERFRLKFVRWFFSKPRHSRHKNSSGAVPPPAF